MTFRLTEHDALHGAIQQMLKISTHAESSGLEPILIELVNMRASQINGCAYCLAMHARALREAGYREDHLHVLPAWRETGWFTDRERAALAWTEAVTTLSNGEVPDEIFDQARAQFGERELADLTLAVVVINGWNRLNVAFHNPPTPFEIKQTEAISAD